MLNHWIRPLRLHRAVDAAKHKHVNTLLHLPHTFLFAFTPSLMTLKRYTLLRNLLLIQISSTDDTESKKGQLTKHAQHSVVCDYWLGRITFSRDDKRFWSSTRELGRIYALQVRQWRPPQSSGSVEGDLSLQVDKAASQLIMPKAA